MDNLKDLKKKIFYRNIKGALKALQDDEIQEAKLILLKHLRANKEAFNKLKELTTNVSKYNKILTKSCNKIEEIEEYEKGSKKTPGAKEIMVQETKDTLEKILSVYHEIMEISKVIFKDEKLMK